jgi:hypothetical protein
MKTCSTNRRHSRALRDLLEFAGGAPVLSTPKGDTAPYWTSVIRPSAFFDLGSPPQFRVRSRVRPGRSNTQNQRRPRRLSLLSLHRFPVRL